MSVLELLAGAPPLDTPENVGAWWDQHLHLRLYFPRSVDLALAGGYHSDRLAWAFASGYQAACQVAVPQAAGPVALCATESGGNHPRAILTRLEGRQLYGEKAFVTLGPQARTLAVVARQGEDPLGRPQLGSALVSAQGGGLELEPLPPTPFAPELQHARLRLDGAFAEQVLSGDGYTQVLRPFRSLEDLHVVAATAGHVLRAATLEGWDPELREAWLALAATARGLEDADPESRATHLYLAGLLQRFEELLQRSEACWRSPEAAERWRRDAPLLRIAARAQAARREKARRRWAALTPA